MLGAGGTIVLPASSSRRDEFIGTYRHNQRGFGFVVPTDPGSHEDLFIPEGQNGGAITGDIVRAKITSRGMRDGKAMYSGRITEIIAAHAEAIRRHAGQARATQWMVLPDGNALTEPILHARCRQPAHQAGHEGRRRDDRPIPADGQRAVRA